MNLDTVLVYSTDTTESYLQQGSIGQWKCNYRQALGVRYVIVCKRGGDQDRSAVLIVKVHNIERTADNKVNFHFKEYGMIDFPDVWPGNRNPVAYADSEQLYNDCMDFALIEWRLVKDYPIRKALLADRTLRMRQFDDVSIEEIKSVIASRYNVNSFDVTITINVK